MQTTTITTSAATESPEPDLGLMTELDLSRELQVARRTLRRWHARRMGPPRVKVGKQILYRRSVVADWLERMEEQPVRGGERSCRRRRLLASTPT